MKRNLRPCSLIALALLACSFYACADVRMPAIFGDHMVLQQGTKLPIWGWALPGEKITVTLSGQTGSAVAGQDGKWRVDLIPVTASSQGQDLTVSGANTVTFQDVLVGDVWIASGQSNMEFGINHKKAYAADLEKSADPLLRLFFVPKTTSLKPLDDILASPLIYSGESPASVAALKIGSDPYRAKWVLCTPEALSKINGQGFATAAYFFARDIRAHTGQPLGIIQSAWGGTRAESWTSLASLQMDPPFTHYVEAQQKATAAFSDLETTYPQRKSDHDTASAQWYDEVGRAWDKTNDAWKAAVVAARAAGAPEPPEPKQARPRPADVHTPDNGPDTPGNLFNAMISPLVPFAVKGVIWYQGEFNSGYDSGREYATLFPRMITDWREHWGQGDFPFIFVQLPNLGKPATAPSETPGSWVWVRDSQLKTLSLPNTGMAITIDIGDPYQLHPPDKIDVGHRLALEARHVAYGEDIVYSGPLYDSMTVEGNKIRLTFKNRGSGLTLGTSPYIPEGSKAPPPPTKLTGFGIAGADQKFVWADAAIDGDTVVVSSDSVPTPVAVRYDWAECPQGDLYNKEGLPASPFRTDDWDLKK